MQAQVTKTTLVKGNRIAVLTRKVDQLAKHTAKLTELKTQATFRKGMNAVIGDITKVATLLDQVAEDAGVKTPVSQISGPSKIAAPVEFVKKYLDEHPDLPRKDAIDTLTRKGVNYATARTQYQRWHKAQH